MRILKEDIELNKGIFWIKNLDNIDSNKNLCFTIPSDINGNTLIDIDGNYISKNGETFNHEKTWSQLPKDITEGKPFNYFPRGRVEINNGKAIIYLNPNINDEEVKEFIINEFNLYPHNGIKSVRMISDGSEHYKCYLDK
jgi:hypothetical protein